MEARVLIPAVAMCVALSGALLVSTGAAAMAALNFRVEEMTATFAGNPSKGHIISCTKHVTCVRLAEHASALHLTAQTQEDVEELHAFCHAGCRPAMSEILVP